MNTLTITWAAARVNAGKTQKETAEYMGVSPNTVVAWEKGDAEPKLSDARKLSEFYNFPLDNIRT